MAFIGKEPTIGNFVKLDAISTSSTNTYNLTLDSVAFSPESPNHCMVSLNGVIQSPSTSFSISGSTITFIPSSGTLSSSDSIDFIMVYGNVLDLGVPSDATVTNAKTNFVSTSSAAGLQIKGDGTTDGTLQLNCSQNSHGIKLKSPAHSASASYTLTFPTTDGNADEFLKTDGSGVLSWATAGGGITEADQWRLTTNFTGAAETGIQSNLERVDTDGGGYLGTGMSQSSGVFTFPSTGFWYLHFCVNSTLNGDDRAVSSYIETTTNNSSYSSAASGNTFIKQTASSVTYTTAHSFFIFDCTNTSTHKARFSISNVNSSTSTDGATDRNSTYMTFIRLGDT